MQNSQSKNKFNSESGKLMGKIQVEGGEGKKESKQQAQKGLVAEL